MPSLGRTEMGRIKHGYLKCPPGFKAKMRRRGACGPPLPTCEKCGGLIGLTKYGAECPPCGKKEREAMEKRYIVPEGMLKAARTAVFVYIQTLSVIEYMDDNHLAKVALEAALRWLSENAPKPTSRDIQNMSDWMTDNGDQYHSTESYCEEWVRRMFLAPEPEPEIPEEIKDLLVEGIAPTLNQNHSIIEAYRRGKAAKE